MENFTLEKDIHVFCVPAKTFPDGIMEAFQKLHALVPDPERKYFGISRPEQGSIKYKAAVEESFPEEGKKLNCEPFVIKSGKYISVFIPDYMKDVQKIGQAFQKLIARPDIEPQGYCIEMYVGEKDVKCMIRLRQQ